MKKKLHIVRFTQDNPPYLTGELAGFEKPVADRLVKAGIAELTGSQVETDAEESLRQLVMTENAKGRN